MTLTEFLLARIAEDEAVAQVATSAPWGHDPAKVWLDDPDMLALYRSGTQTFTAEEFVSAKPLGDAVCVAVTGPEDDAQAMADAAHIARFDPARVLAECEAKRRIVEVADAADDRGMPQSVGYMDEVLKLLALPYADHLDYREEWNPTG